MSRKYRTSAPITDEIVALHYLGHDLGEGGRQFLVMRDEDYPPTIHRESYNSGPGQMEYSGTWYYEVDPGLARKMIESIPLQEALREIGVGWKFGQTYVLDQRVRTARLRELQNKRCEDLRLLLKPGVHSKWSSMFLPNGVNIVRSPETPGQVGRLCFYFKTPHGDRVRIFSDTQEIEQIELAGA